MRFDFLRKKGTELASQVASQNEAGYTLIEVVITIFIMGIILLVVNVVLISLIRVAYDTDARIRIRQSIEFGLDVMRRNTKSADISMIEKTSKNPGEGYLPEGLSVKLSDSDSYVEFYVLVDEDDRGVLIADWGDDNLVHLTSAQEVDVEVFEVEVFHDEDSGTVEIILTIEADSSVKRWEGEPVVEGIIKQTTIVTRSREI